MKKIDIIFIISNLGQGGAEKQFATLVTKLDPDLFKVTVFLYAVQVEPFYKDLLENVKLIVISNKLKNTFSVFKIIEALLVIHNCLKKNNYDIVVTSLFMNNLFVRIAAPFSYRNKIITNMRTSFSNYSSIYRLLERIFIRNSYVVFNSRKALTGFQKEISSKYHHKLFLIYNGFDAPTSTKLFQQNRIVFGSLGRFSFEKNIIQIVRVYQKMEFGRIASRLIIQGHYGNQKEEIDRLIKSENIEVREKNINVDLFYDSITILVIPSLFEGCPNVLFEGLLRKKLCIISIGANSDGFIHNGLNGFVYDGTDDGLFRTMISVKQIINTAMAERIIESGFQYAKENFSISSMVKQYESLFLKNYEENKSRC